MFSFFQLLRHIIIPGGGVVPQIHKALIPKVRPEKKAKKTKSQTSRSKPQNARPKSPKKPTKKTPSTPTAVVKSQVL